MYRESKHPYDSDEITVDLDSYTCDFRYYEKPTYGNYLMQGMYVFYLTPLFLFAMPLGYIVASIDYFFKKNITSKIHKFLFNYYLKRIPRKDWIKASQKVFVIRKSLILGFEWEATDDHRKFLKQVKFEHGRNNTIPFYFFGKLLKNKLKVHHGNIAKISFIFSEVPKTGLIHLRSF